MPKKTIDLYEIIVKITVRKDYWMDEAKLAGELTQELICDKIQQGLEVPLESINVSIVK